MKTHDKILEKIKMEAKKTETIEIHFFTGDVNGVCKTCGLPEGMHEL